MIRFSAVVVALGLTTSFAQATTVLISQIMVRSGSRVISTSGTTGIVREIFADGRASIAFDGYPSRNVMDLKTMGVGVKCLEPANICEDDRVISKSGTTGKVREIFSNGLASVNFDGYPSRNSVSVKDLGVAVDCAVMTCSVVLKDK